MTRPDKRAATCCTGECNQGRTCPLLPQRTPIVARMPAPRVQMQVFPTPRTRRVRRFLRDLVRLLTSPRFQP